MEGQEKMKEQQQFRIVKHIAVTTDPRKNTMVIVAVLDDGTFWISQGDEDWIELQGVPGTQVRDEQDAGSAT